MKLAVTLIVIGILLFVDGMIRVAAGATNGNPSLMVAGLLTGLMLGGFLFYKGIRRYQCFKKPS